MKTKILCMLVALLAVAEANPSACPEFPTYVNELKAKYGADAEHTSQFFAIVAFLDRNPTAGVPYSHIPGQTGCADGIPDRLCAYTKRSMHRYRQRIPSASRNTPIKDRVASGRRALYESWMQFDTFDSIALCDSVYRLNLQS